MITIYYSQMKEAGLPLTSGVSLNGRAFLSKSDMFYYIKGLTCEQWIVFFDLIQNQAKQDLIEDLLSSVNAEIEEVEKSEISCTEDQCEKSGNLEGLEFTLDLLSDYSILSTANDWTFESPEP